jgi:hypothetical protein
MVAVFILIQNRKRGILMQRTREGILMQMRTEGERVF